MKLKMLMKAAFKIGNFALLAGVAIVAMLVNFNPVFILVGLAAYLYFVMQTLKSEKFINEFNQDLKLEGLQKMSWECNNLYRQLYRSFDKVLKSRAVAIMKQKEELMEFFEKYSDDVLKQTIVEQALKLVNAYINLVHNYSLRKRELYSVNVTDIMDRINYNNRKLGTLKSYEAVLELTKAVELDEKLLQRIKDEREELERASVKLDYIESTIGGFKHRIMSSESADPDSAEIEQVINEATALDNVLNERSRDRLKL